MRDGKFRSAHVEPRAPKEPKEKEPAPHFAPGRVDGRAALIARVVAIRGGDASSRGGCGALSATRLEMAPRPSANQGFHFFDIGRVFFVVAGSQVAQAGPNPFPESPPLISPDNFSERLELISPGWAHQSIRLAVHEGRRLLTFERRMHDRLHGIDRPGEKSP
jgi:hypothetical protein